MTIKAERLSAAEWWKKNATAYPEAQDWWGGQEEETLCKLLEAYASAQPEPTNEDGLTFAELKQCWREDMEQCGQEQKELRDRIASAQPWFSIDALVADLRDHYNTDWDTTVPGKEFDSEIRRIVTRHLADGLKET